MKLFDKYNRFSLVVVIVMMVVTGVVYYCAISAILTSRIDKDLDVEENEIFEYVRQNHTLPQVFKSEDQQIYFKPISANLPKRVYLDTSFYNSKENDNESGRGLLSSVTVNGKNYQIYVIESKVETEDLIRIIFLITLGLIILVVVILYIINRLAIKKLWQPFYQTLHDIKLFNLADKRSIVQSHSDIEEFQELNESVGAMALRVVHDYQELKNFIENASHELMTPIAVINSKLDTMIQEEDLNQRQSELFGDIYETVSKLTRLNKTMLLLSKIENKLINDDQLFSVREALESAVNQFQELFAAKGIKVNAEFTNDHQLTMSRSLFDVLMNNLLSNAMRHNYPDGRIDVILDGSGIKIKNTGKPVPLDSVHIFQRFRKSAESEGSGLGLTLSKQICENYHLNLDYSFADDLHVFTVIF